MNGSRITLVNSVRRHHGNVSFRSINRRSDRANIEGNTDDARRYHREKGIIWILVTTIAISLLSYQLVSVAQEYLRYDIETRIRYTAPVHVSMPGVSICFDKLSIVNRTVFEEKFKNKTFDKNSIMETMSIIDVFNMTPLNHSIIKECKYRTIDAFDFKHKQRDDCHKFFEVKKYQKLHKLCYDIRSRKYFLFKVTRVMQGLEEPGNFVEFTLYRENFPNVSNFIAIIHDHQRQPRGSELFPSYDDRKSLFYTIATATNRSMAVNNSGNSADSIVENITLSQLFVNEFTFSFSIFCNYFLPPPYPTNCLNYNLEGVTQANDIKFESQGHCIDSCIEYQLKNHTKVPGNVVIMEEEIIMKHIDGNKNIFSPIDYTNVTLMRMVKVYEKKCKFICGRPNCAEKFYDTRRVDSGPSDNLVISIHSYKSLPFYTDYLPKMIFTQFLVEFLSCFGIWITADFTTLIDICISIHKFFNSRILKN